MRPVSPTGVTAVNVQISSQVNSPLTVNVPKIRIAAVGIAWDGSQECAVEDVNQRQRLEKTAVPPQLKICSVTRLLQQPMIFVKAGDVFAVVVLPMIHCSIQTKEKVDTPVECLVLRMIIVYQQVVGVVWICGCLKLLLIAMDSVVIVGVK